MAFIAEAVRVIDEYGDESTDEPTSDRSIRLWTAEFADLDLETEFHQHYLDATARRVRTTAFLGAVSVFAFTFSDLARLGFGPAYVLLLALRAAMLIATIAFCESIRRRPANGLSWQIVTGLETWVLGILFVVMAFRPGEAEINNLGIAVTVVACFLLIPNRFIATAVISTIAVTADIVVAAVAIDLPTGVQVGAAFTLATFVLIGALSANQLQRARREEFLALRHEQQANDRLVGEISRRRVLENELTWLAMHDPLTDLLNRRAFYECAEREAARARRTSLPLSILVLDADEFKAVNDRFGHHAGDEALKRIAAICKVHLRADDIVGRIGGEEFAVIMPGAAAPLAGQAAERLREAIAAEPVDHPEGPIPLSVSIGVTEYRAWQETMVDGMHRADEAMYLAKASGRNCVVPV